MNVHRLCMYVDLRVGHLYGEGKTACTSDNAFEATARREKSYHRTHVEAVWHERKIRCQRKLRHKMEQAGSGCAFGSTKRMQMKECHQLLVQHSRATLIED